MTHSRNHCTCEWKYELQYFRFGKFPDAEGSPGEKYLDLRMEDKGVNHASSQSMEVSEIIILNPKQMLSRFYALQEERVQTYRLFEEGFQAYLRHAPNYHFPLYRQLVHEITETFNKISLEILSIKSKFSDETEFKTVATIIEKIQDSEKQKLELTAKLQICRQKQVDEPDDESIESEVQELKQGLREVTDALVEQMDELKYESEDIYAEDDDTGMTGSSIILDR